MVVERLTDIQKKILLYCYEKGDMVDIAEMTADLSEFRKSYSGRWFREELLTPGEMERYKKIKASVSRGIRALFEKGYVDVGNEDTFGEGIKKLHRRLWEAKQDPSYFLGEESKEFIEREIAFSEELMNTRDFNFVKKELDGEVEIVGLTEEGVEKAKELGQ